MSRAVLVGLLWLGTLAVSGCGGYASTSEAFRKSLTAGRPDTALVAVNKAMEVKETKDVPTSGADATLLLLERATILQAMGQYETSSRDYQLADKDLEVIDYTSDTAGDIGKYLYSDDAQQYRAPPHEKLLVNTMNLINYLVRGDLQGAKVEARRFLVNQKYFEDSEDSAIRKRAMVGLSSYLAGVAFEAAGDGQEAMRFYGDCMEAGGAPTLDDAVRRLAARTGADDARLKEMIGDPPTLPTLPEDDAQRGELLVIVQSGMSPYRYAERLPIGAAVVAASSPGPGARLSSEDQRQANVFAAKGIVKWVNFSRIKKSSKSAAASVDVSIEGQGSLNGGVGLDVEARVIEVFEAVEGGLIAAAIIRLIARAVAGEVTNAVVNKASGSGGLGLLAGLVLEGAMTAADTPDTRSWVTLPGRYHLSRARLTAGKHTVRVRLGAVVRSAPVEIRPGGFVVLNFSDLR
ncbi:MAG: hypothetical protein EXR76_05535 [Myxococcales bacterium]|nr:hypothetical protein [Myxococcales bacterium]